MIFFKDLESEIVNLEKVKNGNVISLAIANSGVDYKENEVLIDEFLIKAESILMDNMFGFLGVRLACNYSEFSYQDFLKIQKNLNPKDIKQIQCKALLNIIINTELSKIPFLNRKSSESFLKAKEKVSNLKQTFTLGENFSSCESEIYFVSGKSLASLVMLMKLINNDDFANNIEFVSYHTEHNRIAHLIERRLDDASSEVTIDGITLKLLKNGKTKVTFDKIYNQAVKAIKEEIKNTNSVVDFSHYFC
jgi:LEA14-like dessication related protein